MVILARGHGSGSVDKQCSNSEVPRSLVRLVWILQHAATLLPLAGDIQAVLNSQTAGVSDIHAWG